MQNGAMLYAGKYSAPDYELIYAEQCDLAVESTMIYHSPGGERTARTVGRTRTGRALQLREQPAGAHGVAGSCTGVLLNREEAAEAIYQQALDSLRPVMEQENTGKTVAFFLYQFQWFRQCPQVQRLCGENDRNGGRNIHLQRPRE